MSFASRLSSALRSISRSPAVRRSIRGLGRAAVRAATEQRRGQSHDGGAARTAGEPAPRPQMRGGAGEGAHSLADRTGGTALAFDYAPRRDDHPDPGEVVWAWVPYEEDLSQGKDRPVLVIAEEQASAGGSDGSGEVLIALMLTSRDRADEGAVTTDEHGSTWVDPPRCGPTVCCGCPPPPCAAREAGWTANATIGSPQRCAPCTAGADLAGRSRDTPHTGGVRGGPLW